MRKLGKIFSPFVNNREWKFRVLCFLQRDIIKKIRKLTKKFKESTILWHENFIFEIFFWWWLPLNVGTKRLFKKQQSLTSAEIVVLSQADSDISNIKWVYLILKDSPPEFFKYIQNKTVFINYLLICKKLKYKNI